MRTKHNQKAQNGNSELDGQKSFNYQVQFKINQTTHNNQISLQFLIKFLKVPSYSLMFLNIPSSSNTSKTHNFSSTKLNFFSILNNLR